jgi:hypothetical protein
MIAKRLYIHLHFLANLTNFYLEKVTSSNFPAESIFFN